MEEEVENARLSRIDTLWSVVQRAHATNQLVAGYAQQDLLNRYGRAIRAYLGAAVKCDQTADDLFQEFACKFLKGDFRSVDPEKGRFRSFVKTVLFRMVALHFRKLKSRKNQQLTEDWDPTEDKTINDQEDEKFLQAWRAELLEQTWESLRSEESSGKGKHFSILRTRVEHAALDFESLATKLKQVVGKPVTTGNARVLVHRARTKFGSKMINLIADSLKSNSREAIEEELIDLRLIDYCREHLKEIDS